MFNHYIDLTENGLIMGTYGIKEAKDRFAKAAPFELPVIPQQIAFIIEKEKGLGRSMYEAMRDIQSPVNDVAWWVMSNSDDTFARAWLDGYQIEEGRP